jgi:hypothetical protein
MAETFTALTGSVNIGGTAYAEVKSIRANLPDIQGVEEVRAFGNQSYVKRTRPEGVCDGTIDFVFQDDSLVYEFGSPTPDDPQGPISPLDYEWLNEGTGSYFRIRFASAYPNSVEFTQDRDGSLEGTISFQCAKKDTSWQLGSPLT